MKKSLKECYTNYFGAGNLEAKYWFIGFEPGGNPICDKKYWEALRKYDHKKFVSYFQNYESEKVEGKGLYNQVFNILSKLNLDDSFSIQNGNKFLNINSKSSIFYTNLFLLKFPKEIFNGKDQDDFINPVLLRGYQYYFNDIEFEKIVSGNYVDRRLLYHTNDLKDDWISIRRKNQNILDFLKSSKIIFILKKGYQKEYENLLGLSDLKYREYPDGWDNYGKSEIWTNDKHILVFLQNANNDKLKISNMIEYVLENSRALLIG